MKGHKKTSPGFEHCRIATSDYEGVDARPVRLLTERKKCRNKEGHNRKKKVWNENLNKFPLHK